MALIGVVLLVSAVLELPLEAWRVFGIEARFGFNRTTIRRFVTDRLLGMVLAVSLGGPLLLTVLWLMGSAGSRWWLAVWLVWMVFTLGVTWAFPRFIAPLFNRFSALRAGTLRDRLTALLARCGFAADGIFVMDGSRRSAHGNAYFTGLGRHKRIVFFDTLMNQLEESELEAVLAHELGHYRRHHIHKSLAIMALSSFLGLALLGWLADQAWFYTAFGVSRPGDAMALLLFLLVVPVFMVFVQPLFGALSRRHEFEADAFAAEHADAGALVSGLVKLYRENASPLVSDPLYAAFHYSHPPPEERVARLQGTS
jgi:STE24 endopeptidase